MSDLFFKYGKRNYSRLKVISLGLAKFFDGAVCIITLGHFGGNLEMSLIFYYFDKNTAKRIKEELDPFIYLEQEKENAKT